MDKQYTLPLPSLLYVAYTSNLLSLRNGQTVDRALLQRLLKIFSLLQTYVGKFEWPFLQASKAYFTQEGQRLIDCLDSAQYLLHVERRLVQAGEMVDGYLEERTRRPLVECIEQTLLAPYTTRIVSIISYRIV